MKTNRTTYTAILAAIAVSASAAEKPTTDPFEPFADLPAEELLPTNATFSISKDGSLLLDGKPRYFPAVLWYGDTPWGVDRKEDDFGPLEWLYNRMPGYEASQRLGVDAGGFYAPLNWMNRIYRPWNKRRDPAFEGPKYGITIGNGLSMYVDMTASEWAHGSIWHADNPIDPDSKVKPETCKKEGHEGELCNHKECGAELGAPGRLSSEAWTQGHQHWMPWSIVHPQGRSLYKHMWEGASKDAFDYAQSVGNRPWCYELLNEPACWDESAYAKKLFAETMKKKYGSIDKLNAAWAASESHGEKRYASFEELATAYGKGGNPTAYLVEYTKFIEDCFASLLAEGAAIIRDKVDPQALATFQPCTIRTRGIDLYTAYDKLGVVCSHTGGRGIMEAHMLRGLADGKPIVDSEMYIGSSRDSIRNAFLDQFQRGYNISYAFKWNRTQKSSYNFLNLDNVKPEALLGIREAKLDALDVAEFFAPRDRGYPREVAVLFSSTTERLAQCAGHQSYKMFDQAIVGCEFAHLCPDVIWEEQIAAPDGAGSTKYEGRMTKGSGDSIRGERLNRYSVLVAAGVDAVRPGVCAAIRAWVEKGGILVLVGEAMSLNEYGAPAADAFPGIQIGKLKQGETISFPDRGNVLQVSTWRDTVLDDSWERLGPGDHQPVFWLKAFGKGLVYFANAKLSASTIGYLTTHAAEKVNLWRCCETYDALDPDGAFLSSIELTPARRGGMEAWIVTPRTIGTKVVRFRPTSAAPKGTVLLRVWNRPEVAELAPATQDGGWSRMVAYRQILEPDANGYYVLPAGDRSILVRGPEAALRKRYSGPRAKWLEPLSAAAAMEAGRKRIEEEKAKRIAARPAFQVDPDKVHPLDLRPFVNRRFVDKVAGDGRDGWTDQGAQQSLTDTPWGVTVCNGVPMDFIRYDQNDYRDCLVMKSTRLKDAPEGEKPYPGKVEGIVVDRKVGNIYFLHAIAWGILNKVETAFTYIVHYGDGTKDELPVRNYREVWDWGFLALTGEMATNNCVKGWANGENKGLYLWRWTNPHPEKAITTIDIVSACGAQIPLIAAISVEEPEARVVAVPADALRAAGGGKGVKASVTNGEWRIMLDDSATSWVTAGCSFTNGIPYSRGLYKRLLFEMNRLPDQWGAYHDHATPQFMVKGNTADGAYRLAGWHVAQHLSGSPFYRTDNDPETWETAVIPFNWKIAGDDWVKLSQLAVQFQQMPTERSGIAIRNIRFEVSDEPPPPLPPPPPPPPAAPDLDTDLPAVVEEGGLQLD